MEPMYDALSANAEIGVNRGMNDRERIRLTSLAGCGGCAAKTGQDDLAQVLRRLPRIDDPNILMGYRTSDDAGVYRLSDELALVQTVDFFPPIVDDPFHYGSIAAANALSDVYAMGGRPLTALNVLGYPGKKMSDEVVGMILAGAAEKAREAGCPVLGGHTIESTEPFFGLCVTGVVHPEKFISNSGGRPGDALILTKPIGTGIIVTAAKADMVPEKVLDGAIMIMETLNRVASEAMVKAGASACTDITGFGLIGHLREVCEGSGVGAELSFSKVPVIDPIVFELAAMGIATKLANYYSSGKFTDYDGGVSETQRIILCDPQTSGGLLVALDPDKLDLFRKELGEYNLPVSEIGRLTADPQYKIFVRP